MTIIQVREKWKNKKLTGTCVKYWLSTTSTWIKRYNTYVCCIDSVVIRNSGLFSYKRANLPTTSENRSEQSYTYSTLSIEIQSGPPSWAFPVTIGARVRFWRQPRLIFSYRRSPISPTRRRIARLVLFVWKKKTVYDFVLNASPTSETFNIANFDNAHAL